LVVLLWPVIEQQNRIKSLHHIRNPLEQKRKYLNTFSHLHQSPVAQLAQELDSFPVNWAVLLYFVLGSKDPEGC